MYIPMYTIPGTRFGAEASFPARSLISEAVPVLISVPDILCLCGSDSTGRDFTFHHRTGPALSPFPVGSVFAGIPLDGAGL